jgi:hypothetical protein
MGELGPGEVPLAGQLPGVALEDRREPIEPDPEQDRHPADHRDHYEQEVPHEQAEHQQQAERDQPRPQQPLVHLDVRLMVVERPGPNVEQDDQGEEEDQRRDPDRPEQVRELGPREGLEQVLPG